MKKIIILFALVLTLSGCQTQKENMVSQKEESTSAISSEVTSEKSQEQKPQSKPKVETVVIPDVSNADIETAKSVILNAGLVPVISQEPKFSDNVPYGVVCETYPAINQEVPKNSKVDIFISKGEQRYIGTHYSYKWSKYSWWQETYKVHSVVVENGILTVNMTHTCVQKYTFGSIANISIGGVETQGNVVSELIPNPNDNRIYDNNIILTVDLNRVNSYKPQTIEIYFDVVWNSYAQEAIGSQLNIDVTW